MRALGARSVTGSDQCYTGPDTCELCGCVGLGVNKTRMRCEYTIKYGYFCIGMLSRYHEEAYLLSNSFYEVDLMTLTRHPPRCPAPL